MFRTAQVGGVNQAGGAKRLLVMFAGKNAAGAEAKVVVQRFKQVIFGLLIARQPEEISLVTLPFELMRFRTELTYSRAFTYCKLMATSFSVSEPRARTVPTSLAYSKVKRKALPSGATKVQPAGSASRSPETTSGPDISPAR